MTITFENDNDVIVHALEKIISFARENHYLFVANCAWWIAGVVGLDQGLIRYIDSLEVRKNIGLRAVSTTPRDIAGSVSVEPLTTEIEDDILTTNIKTQRKTPRNIRTKKTIPENGVRKLSRNQRRKLAKIKRNQVQDIEVLVIAL